MSARLATLCGLALACAACSSSPSTTASSGAAPDASAPGPERAPQVPVGPLFIGTGGFGYAVGSAFPGASAPQGLAKVGPDTSGPWGTVDFLHCSGYWYGDDTIQGFSHLHLHGTGAVDYGVLGVMPTDAFDASRTTAAGYASTFKKASEAASPGLYAVTLDRGDIRVEVTATTRAAHHRFTYPKGARAGHVVFDLDHHLRSGTIKDADVTLDPAGHRVSGRLRSLGGMSTGFGGYDVFFEARTRAPWTASQVWTAGKKPAPGTQATGSGVGFELDFDVTSGAPIELQVGLSLVSGAAAAANLAAELPAWDFDATAKQTAAAWDALLGTVRVTGGTDAQRSMLTGFLYKAFLMPSIQSDTAGTYRGMDDQVHVAQGFRYVSDMSLWDTYRTLHPLYALIAPDRALDSVRSLHEKAKAGGFFPKWPIATGEAGTMIGASAEIVVADAYAKGLTGFDAEGAYGILRAAAMDPVAPPGGRGGRSNVEDYMKYGYVPAADGSAVSLTTEFANEDFALADLASRLGHGADAATLRARALGYRELFDPATGFLWAKNADGTWASPHGDPTDNGLDDFREADAWQSVWMVARDVSGLAALYGGNEQLVAKLGQLFMLGKQDFDTLDLTNVLQSAGMRPYYWGGNEPDINAGYVFAAAGRPDLTQQWVAWARDNLFGPGAEGIPGNDDGGTMSAWWIFSALGFYPVAGSDQYVVGAPLFPHAEVAVKGGTFTIDAPDVSSTNLYVQSVTLNGSPLATAALAHADLRPGGSLVFAMGAAPSAWGK